MLFVKEIFCMTKIPGELVSCCSPDHLVQDSQLPVFHFSNVKTLNRELLNLEPEQLRFFDLLAL